MSGSSLVKTILNRLREAGYHDLAAPLRVANVKFEFTAALRGSNRRALDLVLVVDTITGDFGDRDTARVRQRIEAFSRALDVTGSRFVVTVILAGAAHGKDVDALAETCRVLRVDSLATDAHGELAQDAARKLEDRIRVLLPLRLPQPPAVTESDSGPAMDQLVRALPPGLDQDLLVAVTDASGSGECAVTDAMASVLGGVLTTELKQ